MVRSTFCFSGFVIGNIIISLNLSFQLRFIPGLMHLKKLLLFLLLLLAGCFNSYSQYKISGILADTAAMTNMAYTSVAVMSMEDSVLQDFTRADEEGKFELNVPVKGNYLIRYAHPMFTSFVADVKVTETYTSVDTIYMLSLSNLLEAFVVRDVRPITIKGDTIEYTADSFKVRAFANVDELLKRLPGIEVDKSGNITAHGKKVEKMLVDGDEFFSDDPAVLAKMLRASAVDKVQVFDNKSETAKQTGVDDGEQVRTINLTLKESAKQGYFGKIEAGAGPPDFYQGQAMINVYRKKQKFTAFTIGSNTNKVGLGWNDEDRFGSSGRSFTENEDGTFSSSQAIETGMGGYDGRFSGQGLPRTVNGGLHYDNKFGKEARNSYGLDYRINSNGTRGYQNTHTQYVMPDTQYISDSHYEFERQNLVNSVAAKTEIKPDSLSTITVRVNGSVNNSRSNAVAAGSNSSPDGMLLNESDSRTDGTGTSYKAGADINYAKKMKKTGRSLVLNFNGNYNSNTGENSFRSNSKFYVNNTELHYNQSKRDSSSNYSGGLTLTYSEPLVKDKLFLTASAGSRYLGDRARLSTFDKGPDGRASFNDSFSTDMDYSVFTNNVGSFLRYTNKPWNLYGGLRITATQYRNVNHFTDVRFARDYLNFFPTASIAYNKSRNTRASLWYNGATQQPGASQIQVVVRNNDPLNVYIGNPDLTQEFRHNFRASYNSYKMISEQSTYIAANVSIVQNAFSESRTISDEGVNTFQTINIDGNWNAGVWGHQSFKIRPLKTNLSLGLSGNYSANNTLLNNIKNRSTNLSGGPSLGLNYYNDTGLVFSYNASLNYNANRNSVNTAVKTNLISMQQRLELSYQFRSGLTIGCENSWQYRQKMDANDKYNNILISNVYLQQSLLKDRSLQLRLEGNDLLNNNVGVRRNNYNNTITDTDYSTIKRYFMFVVTWNFTRSKESGQQAAGTSTEMN